MDTACPTCSNGTLSPLYLNIPDYEYPLPVKIDLYRCLNCALILQVPLPNPEKLKSYYPKNYSPYISTGLISLLKDIQASVLLKSIERFLPNKNSKILELGPGAGHFLKQLKNRGYNNLFAVDWSGDLRENFKALNIDLSVGNIDSLKLDGIFDFIILNNVLEHLGNPIGVVASLKNHLSSQGRILIRTPNADSISHHVFKKYWAGLHTPRHTVVFNPQSFKALAEKAGYRNLIMIMSSDPSTWGNSIHNAIGLRFLFPLFLALCYPMALVEHLLKRSSSVIFVLRINEK